MPSFLLGNRSGGDPVISGNPWSGQLVPAGTLLLHLDRSASGNAYYGFSGGMTIQSGGFFLSGGGLMDGMALNPGESHSIPKYAFRVSGTVNLFAGCDPAASGQGRLYWEAY